MPLTAVLTGCPSLSVTLTPLAAASRGRRDRGAGGVGVDRDRAEPLAGLAGDRAGSRVSDALGSATVRALFSSQSASFSACGSVGVDVGAVGVAPDRGLGAGRGGLLGERSGARAPGELGEVVDLRVGVLQDPADLPGAPRCAPSEVSVPGGLLVVGVWSCVGLWMSMQYVLRLPPPSTFISNSPAGSCWSRALAVHARRRRSVLRPSRVAVAPPWRWRRASSATAAPAPATSEPTATRPETAMPRGEAQRAPLARRKARERRKHRIPLRARLFRSGARARRCASGEVPRRQTQVPREYAGILGMRKPTFRGHDSDNHSDSESLSEPCLQDSANRHRAVSTNPLTGPPGAAAPVGPPQYASCSRSPA